LLRPVLVEVSQTYAAGTRKFNPPGPDSSGYDDVWREPVLYIDPTTSQRKDSRITNKTNYTFLAQVEVNREHVKRYDAAGDFPDFDILLVASVRDLVRRGYMETDGRPKIQVGDRVLTAKNKRTAAVQATWTDLWIVEWRHASWGFGAGRDLVLFICQKREQPA
jgi:hypothetical protein